MKNKKFKLSHLFLGIIGLLIFEALLLWMVPVATINEGIILIFVMIGVGMNVYVAIEAIEEVRRHTQLLIFLSLIVLEFIVFFSFEYWYLILIQPASFPTLGIDAISLLLHSTMVFVFNPFNLPNTMIGRALMLINTLGALSLVLFVLQNIWQIHPKISNFHQKKIVTIEEDQNILD